MAYWNEVKPEDERVKGTESLEIIPKKELNELLANFWPNAKKQNGDRYKKSALMGIRFGLQRHFLLKREFDIISDSEFSKSNQIFEAAIVELKRQGFGKIDHHSPISKEDLEKIQSSYNPSSPDPKSLQQVVWFNIMFHLIRPGRENLRLLTKESFAEQVDAAGKKFVYQVVDELDKNHRANDQPDDSPGEGRMYERLGTFMSSITKELKLSQKYTNHCIRTTAVSLLDECNFEARHIMRVSGHKSESSIRSYSRRLSEVKRKEISHALTSATSTAIVAMHEQVSENSLSRSTVPNSPVTMQNFASHSQETVNFNAGAFSGANVTINFYNSK